MDLVQEEHLPLAQVGEDGGEIALNLQRRAGSLLEAYAELVRDDSRERRLAESRRPEQQYVVHGLAARLRRFQRNRELLLRLLLPDELGQPARPQLQLKRGIVVETACGDQPLGFRRGIQLHFARGAHSRAMVRRRRAQIKCHAHAYAPAGNRL